MATAVENPSITSATEKAASILYGNEKPVTPVIAEYNAPIKEEIRPKPTFAAYYQPEPVRTVRPTEFRAYEPIYEPTVVNEPRVVRPFVDPNTVVEPSVPVTEAAPVAVTSKAVQSEIDIELEEDTQYVVKFKTSTVVAAATLAAVFVLLAILFVVNIVNLCAMGANLNHLIQQEQTSNQQVAEMTRTLEGMRQAAANASGGSTTNSVAHYQVAEASVDYQPAAVTITENSGFFDWLCQALSNLFG